MGRPTGLTAPVVEKICEFVRAGNPPTTAAGLIGISHSTIALWRAKGEKEPESIFGTLVEGIAKAQAEFQRQMLEIVVEHAKKTPKMAMQVLIRRDAEHWGRRDNLTVTTIDDTKRDSGSALEKLTAALVNMASKLPPPQ